MPPDKPDTIPVPTDCVACAYQMLGVTGEHAALALLSMLTGEQTDIEVHMTADRLVDDLCPEHRVRLTKMDEAVNHAG